MQLPDTPGLMFLAAACCALAALLCLLAAAITATLEHRKAPAMQPDTLAPIAIDERSPDWCHRHNCPLSQCDPRGH